MKQYHNKNAHYNRQWLILAAGVLQAREHFPKWAVKRALELVINYAGTAIVDEQSKLN